MSHLPFYCFEYKFSFNLKIHNGKNLPAMDKSGTSDPFCRFTLRNKTFKTKTIKKTLNPEWDEEFRFTELDRRELVPIEISCYDWDRFSTNDLIGTVKLDLPKYLNSVATNKETEINHTGDYPIVIKKKKKGEKEEKILDSTLKISFSFKFKPLKTEPLFQVGEDFEIGNNNRRLAIALRYSQESLSQNGLSLALSALTFKKSDGKFLFPLYYANQVLGGFWYVPPSKSKYTYDHNALIEINTSLCRCIFDLTVFVVSLRPDMEDELDPLDSNNYSKFCDITGGCELNIIDLDNNTIISTTNLDLGGSLCIIGALEFGKDFSGFHFKPKIFPEEMGIMPPKHFGDVVGKIKQYAKQYVTNPPKFDSNEKMILFKKPQLVDFKTINSVEPTWIESFTVGLGWDTISGRSVDLDASVLLFDSKYNKEIVYYGRLQSKDRSVRHMGDNRSGRGDGDDEKIVINLKNVDKKIQKIVVVITSFTGQRFSQLSNTFIRLLSPSGNCFLRYDLDDLGDYTALVVAAFHRFENVWAFEAIGKLTSGKNASSLVKIAKTLCEKTKL
ncbi:camp-binding protein 1-related [Anaeramoeba flamelloides]|uniref:Camp-binding protein 1-related n=1 Tax=Anaeramoeba flamelloides TaxID=1746091 RepID=A0AAV7YFD7_9EUKA|nr:camp-binding protein 1-related [Anaeramoeba flamelloides]